MSNDFVKAMSREFPHSMETGPTPADIDAIRERHEKFVRSKGAVSVNLDLRASDIDTLLDAIAERDATITMLLTEVRVCVLCGEPWIPGVKNRCECGGLCTWGATKGAQPDSWNSDGTPKVSHEGMLTYAEKSEKWEAEVARLTAEVARLTAERDEAAAKERERIAAMLKKRAEDFRQADGLRK